MAGRLRQSALRRADRRAALPARPSHVAGWQAGLVACLALAVWGLHVQFSTTAASESRGAPVHVVGSRGVRRRRSSTGALRSLLWAAGWLTLAEAVRYDAWMYPPVLAAAVVLTQR